MSNSVGKAALVNVALLNIMTGLGHHVMLRILLVCPLILVRCPKLLLYTVYSKLANLVIEIRNVKMFEYLFLSNADGSVFKNDEHAHMQETLTGDLASKFSLLLSVKQSGSSPLSKLILSARMGPRSVETTILELSQMSESPGGPQILIQKEKLENLWVERLEDPTISALTELSICCRFFIERDFVGVIKNILLYYKSILI